MREQIVANGMRAQIVAAAETLVAAVVVCSVRRYAGVWQWYRVVVGLSRGLDPRWYAGRLRQLQSARMSFCNVFDGDLYVERVWSLIEICYECNEVRRSRKNKCGKSRVLLWGTVKSGKGSD